MEKMKMVSKDYGNFNSGDSINPKKSKLDAESLEKLNKMKLEELLKQALSGKQSDKENKELPNLSEAELQKIQEQIQKEIYHQLVINNMFWKYKKNFIKQNLDRHN